ncbi:MAG: YmdB family metallophosphoesterase [Spirochaetaceae bacterium]|jgi:metallophosphoesterase (TIGR00282 family)|nr:YmdB family metallophosphoesterase [Spirochaetaceae bacterium]
MKVLYVAEIVGKAGIACCKKALMETKTATGADFVIACADGATTGNGLGRSHAAYLRKLGADVLTMGECCFYKKDLTENFNSIPYVLRPANLASSAPGTGARVYKTSNGQKLAVAVLLGQSHFNKVHADNPFQRLPVLLEQLHAETPFVIVEFHAEATAEKLALFALAAGKASAVIGSHTRVQTADNKILKTTAVITCAGRTGSIDSSGGCNAASKINSYISGIPDWSYPAWDRCELQGVLVDLDERGAAVSIERIRKSVSGITPENSGG